MEKWTGVFGHQHELGDVVAHWYGAPDYCTKAVVPAGFRSRSRPEPGYLAGAGAVTLARLRLHLKYLLNNSCKIYGT